MPLLRWQISDVSRNSLVFVDGNLAGKQVNRQVVLSFDDFVSFRAEDKAIALDVADSAVREKVATRCIDANLAFFNVSAGSVMRMDDVVVGEWALLSPNVVLTSNIVIGKHFHANISSYVEHDASSAIL